MPDLHPDSVAFLELLGRAGGAPFHELPLEVQRSASEKMMFAFRPSPPDVARATEAQMARPDAAGGPLRYRYYRPIGSAPEARLPALVWYHGGGCVVGNIESYDGLCRELANRSGCAVVAASYRLAPEAPFPAAVEDAFFALRWVSEHADTLHIDNTRLAVGGDSAGGYLAIVASLLSRDEDGPPLRFQLLVYPGVDQRGERASHRLYGNGYLLTQESLRYFQRCYFSDDGERLDWRASPILAASLAGLPPALVLTASHDPIVDDCRAYAERLAAEGVAVRYAEYAGQIHGFFALGKVFREAGNAVAEAAAALREALEPGCAG